MSFVLLSTTILLASLYTGSANPVILPSFDFGSDTVNSLATSQNCPQGYSRPDNSNWNMCYRVYNIFKSRDSATAQCASDNGFLASIPNAFVNSYVASLSSSPSPTFLWIGVECMNSNSCTNDDKTVSNYTNWKTGEPQFYTKCVSMYSSGKYGQKWASSTCTDQLEFACESKAKL